MIIIQKPSFFIAFGDSQTALIPETCSPFSAKTIHTHPSFQAINHSQLFTSKSIIILKQTHSAQGFIFSTKQHAHTTAPRSLEGDFLITPLSHTALALLTADCLPMIIVDPKKQILTAVHAGWKGLFSGIIFNALQSMNQNFQCNPCDLLVWIGPSGRSCCYEVQDDFKTNSQHDSLALASFHTTADGHLFFDLATYAQKQLLSCTILKKNIHLEHALCTICSPSHCSFRRNNKNPERNITIATLL